MPALTRVPSIFEHIRRHTTPEGRLAPAGLALPDDGFVPLQERTPPGVRDALALQRPGRPPSGQQVQELLDGLADLAQRPSQKARKQLEALMRPLRCVDVIDPLLQAIRHEPRLETPTLYNELYRLATETHWREVVKLCVALLGLYRRPDTALLLEALARHEEFTFCAAVALGHVLPDPVPTWLRLAGQVEGWGKIHLADRLCQHADRPDVRDWLLRAGCDNAIHPNHSALRIAESCHPHLALTDDDALARGIQHILDGLLMLGPRPGMERYGHGPEVVRWWLDRQAGRPPQLDAFLTCARILQWTGRPACNWPPEVASALKQQAEAIVALPAWPGLALAHLEDSDSRLAWQAREVARWLYLPVFDRLFPRLAQDPRDSALWLYLAATATPEQMEQLLATPGHDQEAVLPGLIRSLCRYPGAGAGFISKSLTHQDPVIRLLALDSLGRWQAPLVTPDLAMQVIEMAQHDPHPAARKSARVVKQTWRKKNDPDPNRDQGLLCTPSR